MSNSKTGATLELIDIQKLQFSDRAGAEAALLTFLRKHEDPSIEKIELRPKPESLNSINGFITYANNERYFFKTHVEESEKVCEYYNAATLAEAGYPVVTAKQISHRPGKQIVLYEILSFPTLFDQIKVEEDAGKDSRSANVLGNHADTLVNGQIKLDKAVFVIYKQTMEQTSAEEHAKAPIHQLFSHRLGDDGRLGLFYRGQELSLDGDRPSIPFDTLAKMRWKINDVEYSDTLEQIIDRSRSLLTPVQGPSIIGHGDAHNGNIFVDAASDKFVMFDPAFAGRHDPLLDITKPLFHNVFARWMYFPEEVVKQFEMYYKVEDDQIVIMHSYLVSPVRERFLQSRIDHVLKPTVELLQSSGMLREDWQLYLRSALFCCPFLTVNLFAKYVPNGTLAERYELPIKLLGLAMAVQFGSASHRGEEESELSQIIDEIFTCGA